MQYKVPQDVQREDKIIGQFTLRQFLFLLGGAMVGYLMYAITKSIVDSTQFSAVIGLTFLAVFAAFALVQVQGRPLPDYIVAFIVFSLRPRKRVWQKDIYIPDIAYVPPKKKKEPQSKNPAQIKTELEKLARILDTRGWEELAVQEQQKSISTVYSKVEEKKKEPEQKNIDDLEKEIEKSIKEKLKRKKIKATITHDVRTAFIPPIKTEIPLASSAKKSAESFKNADTELLQNIQEKVTTNELSKTDKKTLDTKEVVKEKIHPESILSENIKEEYPANTKAETEDIVIDQKIQESKQKPQYQTPTEKNEKIEISFSKTPKTETPLTTIKQETKDYSAKPTQTEEPTQLSRQDIKSIVQDTIKDQVSVLISHKKPTPKITREDIARIVRETIKNELTQEEQKEPEITKDDIANIVKEAVESEIPKKALPTQKEIEAQLKQEAEEEKQTQKEKIKKLKNTISEIEKISENPTNMSKKLERRYIAPIADNLGGKDEEKEPSLYENYMFDIGNRATTPLVDKPIIEVNEDELDDIFAETEELKALKTELKEVHQAIIQKQTKQKPRIIKGMSTLAEFSNNEHEENNQVDSTVATRENIQRENTQTATPPEDPEIIRIKMLKKRLKDLRDQN